MMDTKKLQKIARPYILTASSTNSGFGKNLLSAQMPKNFSSGSGIVGRRHLKKQIKQMYYEQEEGLSMSPKSSATAIKSLTTINTIPQVAQSQCMSGTQKETEQQPPKWLTSQTRPKSNNFQQKRNPYKNIRNNLVNNSSNSDATYIFKSKDEYSTAGI
jgi:hypothetical protein